MKEWLNWINIGIAILVLLFFLSAFLLNLGLSDGDAFLEPAPPQTSKTKPPFQLPSEAYDRIGEPALGLKSAPIGLQLPDLKKVLVYYGKNGRPDADPKSTVMNFGFLGTPGVTPLLPNMPAYIVYDKKRTPPRYEFSPNNAETPLWIEFYSEGNQAFVQVGMKDENGELITAPSANRNFAIPEKPLVRTDNASWEIGKYRVDGTLLARQKARWYGVDRFFEKHGGEEFENFIDKQRIEFGEGENAYAVYVQLGDVLAWKEDHWSVEKPGEETLGRPILVVRKVDDRLLSFELWDVEGKTKIILNLLKTNEPAPPQNLLQAFKFVGSRTRSQFVFEINKQRVMLSPHDWLLQIDKGWKKLTTHDEIDDYVDGRIVGYLFVFDGVEKRDDRQVLVGSLFNKSRSDFQRIEMSLETGATLAPVPPVGAPGASPQSSPPAAAPRIPISPKATATEKVVELHPHHRTDIREYKKNLR